MRLVYTDEVKPIAARQIVDYAYLTGNHSFSVVDFRFEDNKLFVRFADGKFAIFEAQWNDDSMESFVGLLETDASAYDLYHGCLITRDQFNAQFDLSRVQNSSERYRAAKVEYDAAKALYEAVQGDYEKSIQRKETA